MVYREPSDVTEEIDHEAVAIAKISRRARRLRAAIQVPLLLVGIACGIVLYFVLRDLQFARSGAHIPWVTGVVSFVPTFGGAFRVAPWVASLVLGPFLTRWRAELATTHGLDVEAFTETTRLLD